MATGITDHRIEPFTARRATLPGISLADVIAAIMLDGGALLHTEPGTRTLSTIAFDKVRTRAAVTVVTVWAGEESTAVTTAIDPAHPARDGATVVAAPLSAAPTCLGICTEDQKE
jgi:hypothetical protein